MHIYIYILCRLYLLNVDIQIYILYTWYTSVIVYLGMCLTEIFGKLEIRLFPPKKDATIRLDDPTRPQYFCLFSEFTLPKTNSSPPKNGPKPKRKLVFQPSFFRKHVRFRGWNVPDVHPATKKSQFRDF